MDNEQSKTQEDEAAVDFTHWNHRVIRSLDTDGTPLFAIHEVHYVGKITGKHPAAHTENPCSLLSESIEGLRWQLEMMLSCLDEPVLEQRDFAITAIAQDFANELRVDIDDKIGADEALSRLNAKVSA